MASLRTVIAENVQEHLKRSDWKAAIVEMEKLFAIDRDPLIRVRIGDARLKLDRKSSAIREYLRAAELFAEKGFVLKALAQYGLVLRLDPSNAYAKKKIAAMETLRPGKTDARLQHAPMEYRMPQPDADVVPHYAS
jgi:tetratricopeptide (TPR) repeat protein